MTQSSVEWLAEKYNHVTWMRNRDEISAGMADEWRKHYLEQAQEMHKKEQAELRQLWIRPQDRMPQDGVEVLITDVEGMQIVAHYSLRADLWFSENHSWFTSEVNYWTPIPEIV